MNTKDQLCNDGTGWLYSETVKDHFFHPRNILLDEKNYEADGVGVVAGQQELHCHVAA